ncbi:hypothetical protein GcLGCM259_1190 [Glutamicibacter creatinolyticus]|uniref:Spore protein YkvP/CgeB glycosyl transferase-like domain-containing protein n=1 Tax=Glutamicibacter creatinolyticus TaxID=162496 RepID=A0A5B7WS60_9MICC|nr:glycosyltransferase [Glutamicibacter creatinolyticus]QCY46931.1 hypothetical protein GcLGCM259_1190 [Glutamicibacter creatinolyticus]
MARTLIDLGLSIVVGLIGALSSQSALGGIALGSLLFVFLVGRTVLANREGGTNAKFRADSREQMKRIRTDVSKVKSVAGDASSTALHEQIKVLDKKIDSSQKAIANGINDLAAGIKSDHSKKSTSPATPVVLPKVKTSVEAVLAVNIQKRAKRPAPIRNDRLAYDPISGDERVKWALSKEGRETWVADDFVNAYRGSNLPYSHQIPVAMIADDFTYGSFQPEFNTIRLKPQTWRQQMESHKPQLFICESAWQGGAPSEHPWQGKIYTSVRFKEENRTELIEILNYCHEKGIPTVFWNKEDPVHFSDRINDFIRTSALFDYVFTTAAECVDLYIRDVGVPYADVLPFAVQPKLFNPVGAYGASKSVNFAGTWYARYPKRAKAASKIIDNVLESDNEMVIYDRMYSSPSPAYAYPERYVKYTRPAISYQETADAYRQSKYGITLNTVTDSDTMFARRVFELTACGAVVLSNTAKGVQHFFGDSVLYADRADFDIRKITDSDYLRRQRAGMHIAFQNTYRHRAEKILSAVGIDFATYFGKTQLVARVNDEAAVERAITYYEENRERFSGLLIVLSSTADQTLAMELTRKLPSSIRVIRQVEIDSRTLRPRNVLKSRKVLIIEMAKGSLLGSDDLDYLLDVGNSMSEPLTVTSRPEKERFRFSRQPQPHNVMLEAAEVFPILAGRSNEQSVFLI